MDWTLIAPEIIVTLTGLTLLLLDFGLKGPGKRTLAVVGLAGLVAALLAVIPLTGRSEESFGAMWAVDPFAVFFKVLFLVTGGLILLLSVDYLEEKDINPGEFYTLVLFAVLGMMVMASSRDLITIYLGLETVSISSYVLAGLLKRDARSNEAAIKYFLVGALASAIILFGVSLLYGLTGTTHLADVHARMGMAQGLNAAVLWAVVAFLLTGFGFKVAAVPFHLWAPDAYEGAPTPITAFFSVGPKAAAFAAMLRIFAFGFVALSREWAVLFAVLALLSMTVANVTALVQTNIKRMLAYSSITHAGYILVALAVGTDRALAAAVFYLAAYTVMNLGAFAVVIMLNVHGTGDDLEDYRGLSQRAPVYAWALVICFLSLIGIPPTAGFFGKFYLFAAALEGGWLWLAVAMVINSVISVGYYYGVVQRMFLVPPGAEDRFRPGWGVNLGLGLAVAGVFLLGIFFQPLLVWAETASLMVP